MNQPTATRTNDIVELDGKTQMIARESDVIDLFGKFYPLTKLIIYQANLHPDFFDLKTKLAGDVLQKLVTYQVKTAFIIDLNAGKQEHFREMIEEANDKNEFRFFETREKAVKWIEE